MPPTSIENPVINSPFVEPAKHFRVVDGLVSGETMASRRPSEFFVPVAKPKKASAQLAMQFGGGTKQQPNEIVNEIRQAVSRWRLQGYPHTTATTKELLAHWRAEDRERRPFFCQVEAAATAIYLAEAAEKIGGTINVVVPEADRPTGATLRLVARDASGRERAATSYRLAIVPGPRRRAVGLPVSVVDDLPGLAERLVAAGHRATPDGDGSVIVSPRLTPALASAVASGARALILARGPAAVPGDAGLPAHVVVHPRHQPPPGRPTLGPIWNLDWLQGWSWVDHAALPGLPAHNPLGHAFEHVAPDHVLLGHPANGWDDVDSALFVGWIHEQVPLVWTVAHGAGSITFTTFTVHPEARPVPDALLDALVLRAARGRTPPPGSVTPG